MMYMPDALRALVELMEADPSKLKHRNCFNVSAMSFDPEMIAAPSVCTCLTWHGISGGSCEASHREQLANSMDHSAAQEEWGWKPEYDLKSHDSRYA